MGHVGAGYDGLAVGKAWLCVEHALAGDLLVAHACMVHTDHGEAVQTGSGDALHAGRGKAVQTGHGEAAHAGLGGALHAGYGEAVHSGQREAVHGDALHAGYHTGLGEARPLVVEESQGSVGTGQEAGIPSTLGPSSCTCGTQIAPVTCKRGARICLSKRHLAQPQEDDTCRRITSALVFQVELAEAF